VRREIRRFLFQQRGRNGATESVLQKNKGEGCEKNGEVEVRFATSRRVDRRNTKEEGMN
jgi:hypothetical protein